MATGDKKRAVMTTDINDANGSYGVIGMNKKGAANGVAELDSTGKVPASQLPSGAGPSPSSATPLMNGVGDAGSSTDYSRGDHVHPSDTSKLSTSGDGSNVTAAFTAASSRTNISTGEKLSVIFGKVAKWFSDLGAAAFRGVDAAPTADSTNLVESGGVKSALNTVDESIAIRVSGNKTTYASGAAIGQYVIVDGSTIAGITDGLYKAAKAIPYNTGIDSTYLTAVSGGGFNDLKSAMDNFSIIVSVSGSTAREMITDLYTAVLSLGISEDKATPAYVLWSGVGRGIAILLLHGAAITFNICFWTVGYFGYYEPAGPTYIVNQFSTTSV